MTEYNKVVYDGQTLIDLTQDDVTASDVRSGVYFHDSAGVRGQGTLTSTSVPTANTIAEWDNDVHMNSEDMTSQEVDDFVDSLNVSVINAVDYIVEQGTSGIWTYRKWNSGKYDAWLNTQFTLNSGTSWLGGYWHKTTYGVPLPSFALTWAVVSAVKTDAILSWYVGTINEGDGLHFYWFNGTSGTVSGAQFGYATITIQGTWK